MIEELFCIVEEEQKVQKEVCNKIKEKIKTNSGSLEQIKNNFREYNQSQLFWTPINLHRLLEPEHPARIVDRVVETLDLYSLYKYYSAEGNPPYNPKMMLKVLFYGYFTGVMSCRGMWNGVSCRADFMFLAGGQVPNFRTINSFRLRHIEEIPNLFSQIVFLCTQLGMVDFKYLAIDGEMIQANASYKQDKNIKGLKEEFKRTKDALRKLVEKEPNEDFTEEVKKEQIAKVKNKMNKLGKMKSRLEKYLEEEKRVEQGEETCRYHAMKKRESDKEKIKLNMTDEEARKLSHRGCRALPSYNHQSAVDGKYGVVCAVKTTQRGDHPDDLVPLVDQAKQNTGDVFENVLADCSFSSYEVLEKIEDREEDYYIPDQRYRSSKKYREPKNKYDVYYFKRNEEGNYTCPDGFPMKYMGRYMYRRGFLADKYEGTHCEQCINHDACTKMKRRWIFIDTRIEYLEKMREKLESDKGKMKYRKRQVIVEPVHGDDQKNRGWRQHHLRGSCKASIEFLLIRIGTNLRKITKYRSQAILAMV
jgi:transposase